MNDKSGLIISSRFGRFRAWLGEKIAGRPIKDYACSLCDMNGNLPRTQAGQLAAIANACEAMGAMVEAMPQPTIKHEHIYQLILTALDRVETEARYLSERM